MNLTRRYFLRSTGALAAYIGVQPLLTGTASAATPDAAPLAAVTPGRTLVVVFLRGGLDGLNLIVPYADPHYAQLRPDLRVGRPGEPDGALDLDGRFGLNPRAAALMPFFAQGQAVAAHAVGYPNASRSHFEEQDVWETGVIGNTLGADGWLNRHLQTSTGPSPLRAVAIGDSLPRILRGNAPAFAFQGLQQLREQDRAGSRAGARVTAALEHAYAHSPIPSLRNAGGDAVADQLRQHQAATDAMTRDAQDLLAQAGSDTLHSLDVLRDALGKRAAGSTDWPGGKLAQQMQTAAELIHAELAVEVIEIDYGGWDTHQRQGNGAQGNFGDKVQELADALAALATDLGPRLDDTLILTLSDFGRTAAQNGSAGTDHGWANCMIALGGGVGRTPDTRGRGRRRNVLTDWPGLGPEQLNQGRDLLHTTDFRDVIAEVVTHHLGNPNLASVLPNHTFKPVGLV